MNECDSGTLLSNPRDEEIKTQHQYPCKMRGESATGLAIKRGGKVSGFISSWFQDGGNKHEWGKMCFGYDFEEEGGGWGEESLILQGSCPGKISRSTSELRS
jgi:hypothetical protein